MDGQERTSMKFFVDEQSMGHGLRKKSGAKSGMVIEY